METSLPQHISDEIKSGEVLFGDDLDLDQLKIWYMQEEEAYANQDIDTNFSQTDPWYAYMRFTNNKLVFSTLDDFSKEKGRLLLIGPGNGTEIEEFYQKSMGWEIHFLEASKQFQKELLKQFEGSTVIEPNISGAIDAPNNHYDVVLAFSVLHHIANVGFLVSEISRVIKDDGTFVTREPCSSMGNWAATRSATPNERGMSRHYLLKRAGEHSFYSVKQPKPILFEPLNKFFHRFNLWPLVSFSWLFLLDSALSKALTINDYYWRDSFVRKFGPSSYLYIFKKAKASARGPEIIND